MAEGPERQTVTSIGTIANEIGIGDRPGERAVTMAIVGGRVRHAYLADAITAGIDVDAETFEALYAAGGLFRDGSIVGNAGRSQANLTRVLWLQFDADLLDFFGATGKEDRTRLLEQLGDADQSELDAQVALLRAALEETFAALRIPIHRLDYTGYGLCAYVYVDPADQTRIDDCRAAHVRLVNLINQRYGSQLVDDQVKDAGTRVTRLPGSYNRKGRIPRLVTSLVPWEGATAPLGVNPESPRPVAHMIPSGGPGMTAADVEAFIAAVAPSWNLGQKHAMALAVAALLAKSRIPEAQALAIVERLSADDAKPWDRKNAVVSTYNRMRAGGAIAGYTALVGMMPAATVAFVDQLLGKYRQAASGPVSIGAFEVVGAAPGKRAKKEDASAFAPTPVPAAAFRGWLGRYVELVSSTTAAPDSYHLACGMAMIGSCIGRRIAIYHTSEVMFPNFFVLLIGPSGRAYKDTAIKRALALPQLPSPPGAPLTALNVEFRVQRSIDSSQGLIGDLKDSSNLFVYYSEFAELMEKAMREATRSITSTLITAFDSPPVLQNRTKNNPLEAHNPFLTIVTGVQPEVMAELIAGRHQFSGFLNRWLLVVGDGKGPISSPPNLDEIAGWKLMREAIDAIRSYPEGHRIAFDAAAARRWDAWFQAIYPRGKASAEEDAMGIRLQTLAKKASLVYAVLDRAQAISVDHLESAIALVDWAWGHTKKLIPTWGEFPEARLGRLITETLARRGPLSKRQVQQAIGHRMGPGVFARIVKAMIENGEITSSIDNVLSLVPDRPDQPDQFGSEVA